MPHPIETAKTAAVIAAALTPALAPSQASAATPYKPMANLAHLIETGPATSEDGLSGGFVLNLPAGQQAIVSLQSKDTLDSGLPNPETVDFMDVHIRKQVAGSVLTRRIIEETFTQQKNGTWTTKRLTPNCEAPSLTDSVAEVGQRYTESRTTMVNGGGYGYPKYAIVKSHKAAMRLMRGQVSESASIVADVVAGQQLETECD